VVESGAIVLYLFYVSFKKDRIWVLNVAK